MPADHAGRAHQKDGDDGGLDRCPRLVAGVERLKQHPTRPSHISNGGVERILVRAGRSVEDADLADEL
jgi:hypothetical protein